MTWWYDFISTLMDRIVPRILVYLLIDWFSKIETRVRWVNNLSIPVHLSAGVC